MVSKREECACLFLLFVVSAIFIPCRLKAEQVRTVWLSQLDLSKMTSGLGRPQADRNIKQEPLSIAGQTFEKGVGSHADSILHIALNKRTSSFKAHVGVDDGAQGKGSVCFQIYGDGRELFDSGLMTGGQKAKSVDVNTRQVDILLLVVTDMGNGIDGDFADWADARFAVSGSMPAPIDAPQEKREILTPAPGPAPKLNNPAAFGTRSGNPFLYRIPATGKRPISFEAQGLPDSLKLDAMTGIITGSSPREKGEYAILLKAVSANGQDQKEFKLIVGDKLALTPPMGWNSWYVFGADVSDADMRAAANAMIASGMADYGYMYVNIDDGWSKKQGDEPYRDSYGNILTNERFPDMAAMTAYIHSKGLRAGLYTSPGPLTCGKYAGSYQHEQLDAQQYAKWGFDFLKHDRCSYRLILPDESLYENQKPYALMGALLRMADRDIVYNVCQYGRNSVWEWGDEVGAHAWRTDGDVGRIFFMSSAFRNIYGKDGGADAAQFAGPGNWNDPDYLCIGHVSELYTLRPGQDRNLHHHEDRGRMFKLTGIVSNDVYEEGKGVRLTPNQQYQYMSLWSLMASPLIFSGDMTRLDDFALNILCNAEVIAVNQDYPGRQGTIVKQTGDYFVMSKPLSDGSIAIGLFSTCYGDQTVKVTWKELGIKGRQQVRDLWRQQDIGLYNGRFETKLPRRGVAMLRLNNE